MSSKHFHAVAWVDHREAKIFHFNQEGAELTSVHSHHPDLNIHHKANSGDSGHASTDTEYMERIVQGFGEAGAIRFMTGCCRNPC